MVFFSVPRGGGEIIIIISVVLSEPKWFANLHWITGVLPISVPPVVVVALETITFFCDIGFPKRKGSSRNVQQTHLCRRRLQCWAHSRNVFYVVVELIPHLALWKNYSGSNILGSVVAATNVAHVFFQQIIITNILWNDSRTFLNSTFFSYALGGDDCFFFLQTNIDCNLTDISLCTITPVVSLTFPQKG